MIAHAYFETEHAYRHMMALCRHFARRVDAGCDARQGRVSFPFGTCEMTARPGSLDFVASADDPARLDRVVDVMTSHLERFAFSEEPELVWQRAPASAGPAETPQDPNQPRRTM